MSALKAARAPTQAQARLPKPKAPPSPRADDTHVDRLGNRRRLLRALGGHRIGVHQAGRREHDEYFLSGRQVPWWLAGASMVATTFAADTPLVVTGLVSAHGVAGNWLWWNMLMSGMLTVFFFARLWRRAHVMTDVEFAEIRYSGNRAAVLRGFPRALPRHPDQPHHPRLGDEGDDQDSHDLARPSRRADRRHDRVGPGDRGRHLLPRDDELFGRRRNVGGAVDRSRSVRHQDERGDHSRRVRGERGRRH